MTRRLFTIFLCLCCLFTAVRLLADIIITRDDMILNGKILEDKKPDFVRFANYHGNFTIKYKQIKEIHRTDSFEGDIEILKKLGKSVNEEEIKTNYQSGMKKLDEQKDTIPASADQPEAFVLMLDVFAGKNQGRLNTVLPSSRGISLSAEIPIEQFTVFKKLYIYGIGCETDYFYSVKDERFIKGFSGAAGPLWRLPVTLFGYNFNFKISAAAGAGWYSVKNDAEEASGIKWNMVLHAGPAFDFHSVVLSPRLRFDYIHDAAVPLYCAGFSLGAGYKF